MTSACAKVTAMSKDATSAFEPHAEVVCMDEVRARIRAKLDQLDATRPTRVGSRLGAVEHELSGLIELLAEGDLASASALELLQPLSKCRRMMDAVWLELLGIVDRSGESIIARGLTTRSYVSGVLGCDTSAAGRETLNTRTLLKFTLFEQALRDGAITMDHITALRVASNPRNIDALEQVEDALLRLAIGLSFTRWKQELMAIAQQLDSDGAEPGTPKPNTGRLTRHHDGGVELSVEFHGARGASVNEMIEARISALIAAQQQARAHGGAGDAEHRRVRSELVADAVEELIRAGHVSLTTGGDQAKQPRPDLSVVLRSHPHSEWFDHLGLADCTPSVEAFDSFGIKLSPLQLASRMENASVRVLIENAEGAVTHIVKNARFATPDQRAAVRGRDGGCAFPGCDAPAAWTQIHHYVRHVDGGETGPDNLGPYCQRHHTVVHSHGWSTRPHPERAQTWIITTPTGQELVTQRYGRSSEPPSERQSRSGAPPGEFRLGAATPSSAQRGTTPPGTKRGHGRPHGDVPPAIAG